MTLYTGIVLIAAEVVRPLPCSDVLIIYQVQKKNNNSTANNQLYLAKPRVALQRCPMRIASPPSFPCKDLFVLHSFFSFFLSRSRVIAAVVDVSTFWAESQDVVLVTQHGKAERGGRRRRTDRPPVSIQSGSVRTAALAVRLGLSPPASPGERGEREGRGSEHGAARLHKSSAPPVSHSRIAPSGCLLQAVITHRLAVVQR